MANNKTLLKAIERKESQIAKQRLKQKHSIQQKDRDDATEEIERLTSEMMRMKQQIKFNLQECDE